MDRVLEASNSLTKCFEAASFGLPLPSSKVVAVVEGLRLGFDFEEDLGGREKYFLWVLVGLLRLHYHICFVQACWSYKFSGFVIFSVLR